MNNQELLLLLLGGGSGGTTRTQRPMSPMEAYIKNQQLDELFGNQYQTPVQNLDYGSSSMPRQPSATSQISSIAQNVAKDELKKQGANAIKEHIFNAGANEASQAAYNAAATEAGGGLAGQTSTLASMGPYGLAAIAALAAGNQIYEQGGKNILKGGGKGADYANLALNVNPMTAPFNFLSKKLTGKTLGAHFLGGSKTTGQRQSEKLQEYINSGVMDARLAGEGGNTMQDQGVDDNKLRSGQLKAQDVWGVSGMFDTFGNDWTQSGKYNEGQREKISQFALDNGLLDSKQGLTRVTDQAKLKSYAESLLSAPSDKPAPQPAANGAGSLSQAQSTVSNAMQGKFDPATGNLLDEKGNVVGHDLVARIPEDKRGLMQYLFG